MGPGPRSPKFMASTLWAPPSLQSLRICPATLNYIPEAALAHLHPQHLLPSALATPAHWDHRLVP